MRVRKNITHATTLGLLVGGFLMLPVLQAATTDSTEINSLLADAKAQALQLESDSAQLDSFTRSKASWESYASQLQMIRAHVNSIGKLYANMTAAKHEGSSWQQQAIDRIGPLLKEMANNTSTVIDHLNKNQDRVHTPRFQDYVKANYDLSSSLTSLISDFVEYGNAKRTIEHLSEKLEIG
jgi:hypothetical protein